MMKSTVLSLTLGCTFLCTGLSPIAIAKPILLTQNAAAIQGSWRLIGWGDTPNLTPPLTETEITANFDGERVMGSAGCNQYNGAYSVTGNTLTTGAIASTKRACLGEVDRQEFQYLTALAHAQSYAINDRGELVITYQTETSRGVLVFLPQRIRGLW